MPLQTAVNFNLSIFENCPLLPQWKKSHAMLFCSFYVRYYCIPHYMFLCNCDCLFVFLLSKSCALWNNFFRKPLPFNHWEGGQENWGHSRRNVSCSSHSRAALHDLPHLKMFRFTRILSSYTFYTGCVLASATGSVRNELGTTKQLKSLSQFAEKRKKRC